MVTNSPNSGPYINPNRKGNWIQTYTGKAFWPLDPQCADIEIVDIAHALSHMCRYNGHTTKFYSVAEHCVHISRSVPPEDALWALLHDAPEAYLSDIPAPLKEFIPGWSALEDAIMRKICDRFNLPHEKPVSIKDADKRILMDEQAQVLNPTALNWGVNYKPLGIQIKAWSSQSARECFLRRFEQLYYGEF